MSNILIIKHGSLGDIAQASGAIQDISESHKDDQIHLLTTKPYFELFKKNPYITNVILDKRLSKINLIYLYSLMRELKKYSFLKVYDLQNSSRTSFYKKILFPKASKDTWCSTDTTLPEGTTKKDFDKDSVLERFNHQLRNSNIDTKHTKKPDFSWSSSDITHINTGVARIKIEDFEIYKDQLKQRLDPTVTIMQGINTYIKKKQKKVVFADGEDENTLKAAIAFKNSKLGIPILIGKEKLIKEQIKKIGYSENFDIEIVNSTDKLKRVKYVKHLFNKLQREKGMLEWDCDRLVKNDRVIWASCMVACKDADAMVTGNTRRYSSSLEKIINVVDPRPGEIMFGLNLIVNRGKTIFICDTSVIEYPNANQLADMAISAARVVRLFGFDPKVAFLSHSTFGQPVTDRTKRISDAVEILKSKKVDFKFDGEMQPDVALEEIYKELYPFSEIVGNSNVLIMPSQHSAAISYKMIKSMSRAKVIGPLLIGLGLPIEIAPLRSSTSEIINLASIAAYSADVIDYKKD